MYIEDYGHPKSNPFENKNEINPFENQNKKQTESPTVIILQQHIHTTEQNESIDSGCIDSIFLTCLLNVICLGYFTKCRTPSLCRIIRCFC